LLSSLIAAALVAPGKARSADPQITEADDSAATTELEEVTVVGHRLFRPTDQTSATGIEMKLVDTPQSISVVTPELMDTLGANDFYDALSLVPGAYQGGSGFGRDHLILRGTDTLDIRINGTRFRAWTPTIEGNAFQRVEIVRGPATVLYGVTSGFGGEVNQILKASSPEFWIEGKFEGGEYDYQRYEFDVNGAIPYTNERLTGRFVGTYENSGTPIEVVDISNNKLMLMGNLAYEFTPDTKGSVWILHEEWDWDPTDGAFLNQLPNGELALPPVPWEQYYFSDARHSIMETSYNFFVASLDHSFANEWTTRAQVTWSSLDRFMSYYYPFGPAGAYGLDDNEVYFYTYDLGMDTSQLTFDASLGGDFELFGREAKFFAAFEFEDDLEPWERAIPQSLGLGFLNQFEGGQQVLADGTPIPLIDRGSLPYTSRRMIDNREYRGSFQLLYHPFDRLQLLAGFLVQHSYLQQFDVVRNTSVDLDFTEVIPRFGVTYTLVQDWEQLSKLNAYFSYSEGFLPNLGIVNRDGDFLTEPQEMEQYEVGMKAEFLDGRVGASIAWYDSQVTNIPASDAFLGQGFGLGTFVLQGKRDVTGVELEVVGEFRPGWNVAFNYAYADPEISDPNFDFVGPVRSVPKHMGALYTSYEFLDGTLRGLRLSGGVEVKGDYNFVDSLPRIEQYGTLETGSHTLATFGIAYAGFTGLLSGLEVFGRVENAFDEDHFYAKESHPGFAITRGSPQTFRAGLRYRFD
jgi:outer membrane receptor for ferric coprogen and ferric-rhodotorulic acid